MRIALDAMGGDDGPQPNIEGAIAALKSHPHVQIALVGDEALLREAMASQGLSEDRMTVCAADGFIGMHEKPLDALRKKPNCSIAVCWQMMASGDVDAVVSAGHTGAMVAAGFRTKLFLKGVKRPGIAVPLPTLNGRCVLMDVGANPGAKPEHLAQYGVMGAAYARNVLEIENPRIGLMNIGSEDGKGNELVRQTHEILRRIPLRGRYIGNVEGRGLYQGEADVVLCEGFVGNVVLKVSEGMADMLLGTVTGSLMKSFAGEESRVQAAFSDLHKRFQYHESGGAPLLGIDGICIISHGCSNRRSIENALGVAVSMKERQINTQIVEEIAGMSPAPA